MMKKRWGKTKIKNSVKRKKEKARDKERGRRCRKREIVREEFVSA